MSVRAGTIAVLALLSGCKPPTDSSLDSPWLDSSADSGDSRTVDTQDTGEPDPVPLGPGVVVLAGGGSEGAEGDADVWSARLYGRLLEGGDVTGDGLLRVAVLSSEVESEWLPEYFEWLGADEAFNLQFDTPLSARDDALLDSFDSVDAVFLKGGDQGVYYDVWNDSVLEDAIRLVVEQRGGGIGGTSAGAMSQSQYALAGSQDLISQDVLEDACSPWLDDDDGGSGIHDDFLGFVEGALVDTHFTERGRLGRLVGTMAKATDDFDLDGLLGIGLEQQTGVVIREGRAEVVGVGAVSFLQPGFDAVLVRDCGQPLVWTGLRLDRLTDGWSFDLETGAPDESTAPADAEAVAWDGVAAGNEGEWWAYGDLTVQEERFAWVVERSPNPYALHEGRDPPLLSDAIGILDAHYGDSRAANHEALFRALYDRVGTSGFLLAYGSLLERPDDAPSQVLFADNDYVSAEPEAASIVLDGSGVSWRSLSPVPSRYDEGDGSLHAAGLVGMRLHVLANSAQHGLAYDVEARAVVER